MNKISILLVLLFLFACKNSTDLTIKGKILYKNSPVVDAEIQVFLKQEKEKETPPIKVVATDEKGEFSVQLPKGKYFLVAKKKHQEQGETEMLFSNYPANPVILNSDLTISDWYLQSKKERFSFKQGTGVKGEISNFANFRNVRVYIYGDDSTGLKGPDYIAQTKIGKDGKFTVDLNPGSYYLVVRERKHGTVGLLKEGDLTSEYRFNPITMKANDYLDLGTIVLTKVDDNKVKTMKEKGFFKTGDAEISGVVVDKNGKPVKNIYVLFYNNIEMVGRPLFISTPTQQDGKFVVKIATVGKYYIGARSKIGGPAEPGELIGTYLGSIDKGVTVKKGDKISIKIEVHEVW